MTAVATELGYTPGAISQQIARLEATVGSPLITKVGRGVRLTDAGNVLADHAESIQASQDAALAAVRAAVSSVMGRVTIGVFGSTAGAILAPLVIHLRQAHPRIEIRSREIGVDDSADAVRRGQVDIAFGIDYSTAPIRRDPSVEFVRLHSERFSLAGSAGLGSGPRIKLAEAAQWPWILTPADTQFGQAVRNACRAAGFEPNVVHEVTDTAAANALANAGLGVTPTTPLMQRLSDAASYTLALDEDIVRHLVMVRHNTNRHWPTVEAVTEAARHILRDGDAGVGQVTPESGS